MQLVSLIEYGTRGGETTESPDTMVFALLEIGAISNILDWFFGSTRNSILQAYVVKIIENICNLKVLSLTTTLLDGEMLLEKCLLHLISSDGTQQQQPATTAATTAAALTISSESEATSTSPGMSASARNRRNRVNSYNMPITAAAKIELQGAVEQILDIIEAAVVATPALTVLTANNAAYANYVNTTFKERKQQLANWKSQNLYRKKI
jgi:hypothetical protein